MLATSLRRSHSQQAGVGLVEVVEVDDEVALRRGVEAEVAQVRVAAHDRADAGGGQVRHVLSHHDGGAAQEPVGRRDHPAHPHRHEPPDPALVRIHDLLHRIGPDRAGRPVAQRLARHPLPQRLPSAYLSARSTGRLRRDA
jgi:hypothetical protein